MCGIAGVFGRASVDARIVRNMTGSLSHRGPDDEGVWIDLEAGIGLGHRRLSIIDVSPAGNQPMHSPSGRYAITFNGEIYNYMRVRADLAAEGFAVDWRGQSDTEVLLAAFEAWGVRPTLQRVAGMFAFALWDKRERTLFLARDRLGEKPLYFGRQHGQMGPFLFGSELKALQQHPSFKWDVDRRALALFMRYLAIPAPLSIYCGISKLLPGTILSVREGDTEPAFECYWSGAKVAREGVKNPLSLDDRDATDALERVLEEAICRQMTADVPLGAFLSGGVDSSTVVALMQKHSSDRVKTFTIGSRDDAFNEAQHASSVARHLGTDHTELYVSASHALQVIPRLPCIFDEPFADSSQIPTHLISALAREHVTVALTGDGGDELFGGYERYLNVARLWAGISAFPTPLRVAAGHAMSMIPASAWECVGELARLLPRQFHGKPVRDRAAKAACMLQSGSINQVYDSMLSVWRDPSAIVIDAPPDLSRLAFERPALDGLQGMERMMAQDMVEYLADDILVKVDRAAMAVSLETRVPLLDASVAEFAWRLPINFKVRGKTTKWLLRQVLYRYVPSKLIDRPKMGFGVPLDTWLREPLRDWAEALLNERRLREEGFLHPEPIRRAWAGQIRGEMNAPKLWPVLVFQSWLESQGRGGDMLSKDTAALVRRGAHALISAGQPS